VSTTELLDSDLWQTAWSGLPAYARARVENEIPPGDRPPFLEFLLKPLEADCATGRPTTLSRALLDSGLVVHAIVSPGILSAPDAIRVARAAIKLDLPLDAKLLVHLTRADRVWPEGVPEAEIARVFEVIDAVSDCRRLIMPLMKFLKLPQKHLRSKVVKLIARASQNPGWADMLLADPDPRVRSNLIEGLATQSGPAITEILQRASKDPHHRVSVTAMLELCRRNHSSSCDEIRRIAVEGDEPYRLAAEWALRQLESQPKPDPDPEIQS